MKFETDFAIAALLFLLWLNIGFAHQIDCAVGVEAACEKIAEEYAEKKES